MDNSTVDKILILSQSILQHQNIILIVVFGITTLLLACTWLWNLFISKKQIKNEIQEKISKIEKELWKRIDSRITSLEKSAKENLKQDMLSHEAEINRLFALICDQKGFIGKCISWWADALVMYNQIGSDTFIRTSTEAILRHLKKDKSCEDFKKEELEEVIDKIKNNVPDILEKERKQIIDILEAELKKK